jgi:hypothetical protein
MITGTENPQSRRTAEIAQLTVNHNPLVITSNYKGIILTQAVQVLNIMPDRVIFQAPAPPLCFTLKEKVHLYSPTFREIVAARLLNLNTVIGKLELADLIFTGWPWNERQSDRVQPQDPMIVFVKHKKTLVKANVDNLSMSGMSLLTSDYKEKSLLNDRDTAVRLTFQLPGSDSSLDLKGKIIHTHQVGKLAVIGVQFNTRGAQEKSIHRYIVARKAEILAELERTILELSEQRGSPDLYH